MSTEAELSWSWTGLLLVVICFSLAGVYSLYLRGLPKPLQGIPFNKNALSNFMGDLPALQEARTNGGGFTKWMQNLALRHNSPLVQVFLGPFTQPALVIFDYRESLDIVLRRTKEFDRCKRDADAMATILPEHHLSMVSADHRFKLNKELVKDLMTPAFLNQISAPAIYKQALSLVKLWTLKAERTSDGPFEAHTDLQNGALDIIMSAAFGDIGSMSLIEEHINCDKGHTPVFVPQEKDEPAKFEKLPLPRQHQTIVEITQFMGKVVTSPFPILQGWYLKNFTRFRSTFAAKEEFVRTKMQTTAGRFTKGLREKKEEARSAMDFMVSREILAASKSGREPKLDSRRMQDELLGYLVAGHETSASILSWTVKFLADNGKEQDILRKHLQAVYRAAAREGRDPTEFELTKFSTPYLEAFLEEALRLARTASIITRQAMVDTTILGRFVPKDTTLFIFTQGPSIVEPAIPIEENSRSKTCQAAENTNVAWDPLDVGQFKPERWLTSKTTADAKVSLSEKDQDWGFSGAEFNPQAGPILTFGGGPRGCFGRRLAYLELRMVVALLVWNFRFEKCPPELSAYDLHESITVEPKFCYVKLTKVSEA